VLDQEFRPSTQEVHKAIIRSDDGRSQTIEMKLLPNQEGRYEGTFVAQRIGNYQATIDLGSSDEKLIDPIAFRVVPPTAESGAFWLNEKLLADIATQSGGKYFQLNQLDDLAESLPTIVTRADPAKMVQAAVIFPTESHRGSDAEQFPGKPRPSS